MAAPQSKPFRPLKIADPFDRSSLPETYSGSSGNDSESHDERVILSSLRELIEAGNHDLDAILEAITDAARMLTGASGAAVAMWKEGAMVCRARTGDTAPALGAQLNAKTGISGECLRTGKIQHCADTENDPLVDLEVCRSLGLRAIAVLPIRGWRRVSGIIEVFSPKPGAFSKQHIACLQQIAALAERARAAQPESARSEEPGSEKQRSERQRFEKPRFEKPTFEAPGLSVREQAQPSDLLPAASYPEEMAVAPPRSRSRPLVLGVLMGLVAILLFALAIWLGWRSPGLANGKAPVVPSSAGPARAGAETLDVAVGRASDNDGLWKANPGGQSLSPSALSPSNQNPSATVPVKLASKMDVLAGKKTQPGRAQAGRSPGSAGTAADAVADDVVIIHRTPVPEARSKPEGQTESHTDLHSEATALSEPPSIPASVAGQSTLGGVLSAKVALPGLSIPVSQGVTGGQLVHRVPPVYPAQARVLRLEGTVTLAAVIMEDGTLRDVRVIEGEPLLAQSAVEAVQQWRYKPYELDGKAVKNLIRIKVDFKFPGPNH